MAKRYRFKRRTPRRNRFRARKKISKPSLVSTMGAIVPQLVSNFGTAGYGYNAVASATNGDFKTAVNYAAANEVLLFTGYDMIGKGWQLQAPLLNYGMMFGLPMLLKKVFHSKTINIPVLGNIKVI